MASQAVGPWGQGKVKRTPRGPARSSRRVAAAQAQSDFRLIFEALPGAFLLLLPDAPRFTIVAVSDACAQAIAMPRDVLLGRTLFEFLPDDPAADGKQNLRASLTRALAQRTPDAMPLQMHKVRRLASDGDGFDERWWRVLNTPVIDAQGAPRYLILRLEDAMAFAPLPMPPRSWAQAEANAEARAGGMDDVQGTPRPSASTLAPAMLHEFGLHPAFEWLARDIQRAFGLPVSVFDDGQSKPLGPAARVVLYRATRELLIHVARHAPAGEATVRIWREGGRIWVAVSDAGVGFDPLEVPASSHSGTGRLTSLRERLSFIGGHAEIRGLPGDGMEARLCALVEEDKEAEEDGGPLGAAYRP